MRDTAFITILITSLFLSSCFGEIDTKSLMPNVSGKAGEVVLILEDSYWESTTGELFKNMLQAPVSGLPQEEAIFRIVRIPSASFSKIFMQHRNIVIVKVSSEYKKSKISFKRDNWAKPQSLVYYEANNREELQKLIVENNERVTTFFLKAEADRLASRYRKYEEISVGRKLRKDHNISLIVPKGYAIDVNNENFVWISHETQFISQGVFVYHYNYIDEAAFELDYLLDMRDSFLKDNVPAFEAGSHMMTDRNFRTEHEPLLHKKDYAVKLSGLWKLNKGYMGGPFVSLSKVDTLRNRIVTAEAYVYAPKFDKRNYIRQVEAIINSLKIVPITEQK